MRKIDILSMGEPMVEFSQTREGDEATFLRGFGGDTSNFAIAAARQGAAAGYISAVGEDFNGGLLRSLWKAENVDDSHVLTDPDAPTGIYFVTHDEKGHHFTFYRSGSAASHYAAWKLPLDAIDRCRVFHFSGISLAISSTARDACYQAATRARASGVTVSFDTNLRLRLWSKDCARAVMTDIMSFVDICLPSYDEIVELTGIDDPDKIIDWILRFGPKIVALKLGDKGAVIADANGRFRVSPYPCRPVDATGAGDIFAGAFIARLVEGDTITDAGHYAAAASALSTEGYGAVAPIPRPAEIRRLLDRACEGTRV